MKITTLDRIRHFFIFCAEDCPECALWLESQERTKKQIKLKYPVRVAGVVFAAGTVLECLAYDDERVQKVWPGIQEKMMAHAIAVQFPHLDFPTLVDCTQVEMMNE